METNKDRKYWIFAGVGVLILITVWGSYKLGYRFDNSLNVGKVGTVVVEIPKIGTDIFIDQDRKITTTKNNEEVRVELSPVQHTVIVSRTGYFPWKKDVTVPSGSSVTLSPIFVTQNSTGEIITKNDRDYYKIRNQVLYDKLPTKNSPRISKDVSRSLWLEDNAIMVDSTGSPQVQMLETELSTSTSVSVIQPDTIIRNVYFYKDRSDYIMFSTSNSVFVIEIDKTGTQNFIPVFRGTSPSFIAPEPSFIYVLDGENLMQVII